MNRQQRRAQWRDRVRRQSAASGREAQIGLKPRLNGQVKARPRDAAYTTVLVNELVLRGFERSTGQRIASTFEHQLSALLRTHSLPASLQKSLARARTEPIRLRSLTDTRRIGEQLAHAVFALQADERRRGSGE
jgi:hypothetical protein